MTVLDRIMVCLRQLVSIDDFQFGFVPGRGTTDAIFVEKQLQEKYLSNKRLHGFCRPGEGVWWSTSKGHQVGAEKTWCGGVDCATGAGDECQWAEPCPSLWGVQWRVKVKVSVHQDKVLSLLCFIIVLEALSCKFRSGFPWEDLFADDLGIITESLEECVRRLLTWKEAMEEKGLSKCRKGNGHDLWYRPGPPAEFRRVSICSLSHWSGQQHHLLKQLQALGAQDCRELKCLAKDPDYRCTQCQGTACGLDSRPQRKVQDEPIKLGIVGFSCYLGDMLSAADGCELSITTCMKTAWKFKELLPVLLKPTLFQGAWPRVQLVCRLQCSMPMRLGYGQNQSANICSKITGQWSDRSAKSSRKTLSPPNPISYLCGLALRISTSF